MGQKTSTNLQIGRVNMSVSKFDRFFNGPFNIGLSLANSGRSQAYHRYAIIVVHFGTPNFYSMSDLRPTIITRNKAGKKRSHTRKIE